MPSRVANEYQWRKKIWPRGCLAQPIGFLLGAAAATCAAIVLHIMVFQVPLTPKAVGVDMTRGLHQGEGSQRVALQSPSLPIANTEHGLFDGNSQKGTVAELKVLRWGVLTGKARWGGLVSGSFLPSWKPWRRLVGQPAAGKVW